MKKFDIQRFAKRRIQVGDNLQGKTIYIDKFPAGYAKEAATFDSWDRFILMDGNDDMMALNYFAIGQLKDENGVSVLENQFGVLTYIGMPGAVDQYIYRGTYDGNTVTNESQLSEMTICSTWISQGSSVVKTIHDNISAYRYFYIEDSHVRPLKIGDEITTDTKFYFNIPDDIELSLTGALTDNYNVVSLDGDNGFAINCINNRSQGQGLIRFSNSMGSTEDGTIYEKMNETLSTNKSLMENVTTMDSNWVGTVKELKIDTPIYELILVDETTLGNYVSSYEKRFIQVGDNLSNETIYCDLNNIPFYSFTDDNTGTFVTTNNNSVLLSTPYNIDTRTGTVEYKMEGEASEILLKSIYDDYGAINSAVKQLPSNFGIVSEIDINNIGYPLISIKNPNIRQIQVGDKITNNTKLYFKFPNNIYKYISENISSFSSIFTVSSGYDGYKAGLWVFNGDGLATTGEQRISLVGEGWSPVKKDIYKYGSNKNITNEIEYVFTENFGEIDEINNELSKYVLVDITTLGSSIEPIERPINTRMVKIGDNLRNKKIYLDISNLDNSYFNNRWLQLAEIPRDIIKCGNISLLKEYPESSNDGYSQKFSLTLLDDTVTLYKVGSYDSLSWSPIEGQLEYQMPDDKDYIITDTIGYVNDTENHASLLCFYIEDSNIRPVQSGDVIDENTKTYINFPYKYSKEWSQEQSFNLIMNTKKGDNKIAVAFSYEDNLLEITDGDTHAASILLYGGENNVNIISSLPIGTVIGFSIEEVPYNANNYILVDTTTLGKAPLVSTGTISYKNSDSWNKLLSLAQEQVPLRGSVVPGPIKWSAVNSTAECIDSKTLYFVFGEEEASPTYETLTAQAKGATYGDSIFGGSGSHTLVVKNSDDEQNEYPYTVSLNGSGFYTDLEFSVVTNKPFQLGITFSYGLDPSMSSNQVSLGATLLDLISYESFSFNTVVTGTEGVGQTYWFPTTSSSGTQLTFDWLKNANLRITSSVSEYGQACLSGDTKIKTLNNDIYISDLELGDRVIDKDNQETEITKIYNHKIDTVYQIHLDNNETIECSYDHKFLVDGGKATIAAQLKENDKLGQYIITSIDIINKELDVYEIKTESNTYTLANGIICECENI